MNQTYNYLDIVLSLREEYKQCREKLEKLKQYTTLKDKQVESYYFKCLSHPELGYTELLLDRKIKKSKLEKRKEKWTDSINLTTMDKCTKNENGDYEMSERFYKAPTIQNQEGFNEQADKILTSSFVKYAYNRIDLEDGTITFNCRGIYLSRNDYQYHCIYDGIKDNMKIQTPTNMTKEDILYLIHSGIPMKDLNKWQQKMIEEHYKRHEIILPTIPKRCKEINVSIEQEPT